MSDFFRETFILRRYPPPSSPSFFILDRSIDYNNRNGENFTGVRFNEGEEHKRVTRLEFRVLAVESRREVGNKFSGTIEQTAVKLVFTGGENISR